MSLKGKATVGGGDFELCPAGNWPGVLVAVVDLGTHYESYQGGPEQKKRKVLLAWEVEAEEGGTDKRLVIGRDYNIGINEDGELVYGQKSALRQLLEGWRGKQYSEAETIDPADALGKPCMVQVTSEKTRAGKEISRVKSCAAMHKKMQPIQTDREFRFDAEADRGKILLPEWLPFVIGEPVIRWLERCLEWGGTGRRTGNGKHQPVSNEPIPDGPGADEDPF